MKSQILLTHIPITKFESGWASELQEELMDKFNTCDCDGNSSIVSFTPLKSMHRIVILCIDASTASKIYLFLMEKHDISAIQQDGVICVHLVKSLLRSSSQSSIGSGHSTSNESHHRPPRITVDTSKIGNDLFNCNSSSDCDGCLTPASIHYSPETPTKIKKQGTDKFVYYKEPQPCKMSTPDLANSSLNGNSKNCSITDFKLLNRMNLSGQKTSNPFIVINND